MTKTVKELQFKIVIEQDEGGMYVAEVPELPGCYTQGKSLEEVRERIREVIQLVLDSEEELVEEKSKTSASRPRFFGVEDITIRYA